MKYLLLLKFWIKKTFNLPVYRKDVLKYARICYSDYFGLCTNIIKSLRYFNIFIIYEADIKKYIPKFGDNVAIFNGNKNKMFWWVLDDVNRLNYLNWLINEYKDDKTNLRNYEKLP